MNIFIEQPEFIELDPRTIRPKGWGYAVTPEFMLARHSALIPPELIKGKRVLDLGSCLAATGAWCLSNGATFYTGVEIDDEFVKNSTSCLKKYYPEDTWSIVKSSIEDFLSENKAGHDVLIASGVLHGTSNPIILLDAFSKSADFLIIENIQTQTVFNSEILSPKTLKALSKDPRIAEFLETDSYIAVGPRAMTTSGNRTIKFAGFNPSMGAIKFILNQLGFESSDKPYRKLRRVLPELYAPHRRFALYFKKNSQTKARSFGLESAIKDNDNLISVKNW